MLHGIDTARSALEDTRKKLMEYDSQYIGVSEKAGVYLSTALDMGHVALSDLGQIAETIKAGPAELPVKAIATGIARVNTAFTQLGDVAKQYDEKFGLSTHVSSVVAQPKEQATAALATIAAYSAAAASAASAQLQGVSDGLRATLVAIASKAGDSGVSSGGLSLIERVKELDEKFGLSGYLGAATAPAQSLDQKVTGGRVSQAIVSAYNMGWNMVGAVQSTIQDKRRKLNE
jgi:hypothetical protein